MDMSGNRDFVIPGNETWWNQICTKSRRFDSTNGDQLKGGLGGASNGEPVRIFETRWYPKLEARQKSFYRYW